MNIIHYIFSFLCDQDASRSYLVDSYLLPFCQRCTGVYIGMGISFLYLFLTRFYRKGFPLPAVIYINIASLLIMPIFGYHLIDPGPAWRLWSGLIFGNAIAFLLLPSASLIYRKGQFANSRTKPSILSFLALFAFLNTIPFWFPINTLYFYYMVIALAYISLICVLFCILIVLFKMIYGLFFLKGVSYGYIKKTKETIP